MEELSPQAPETAGKLLVKNVPKVRLDDSVKEAMEYLAQGSWDDIHSIYVVSEEGKLEGVIPLQKIVSAKSTKRLSEITDKVVTVIKPDTDQEKVAIEALQNDLKSVPVVSDDGQFLGAVSADKIIDILHEEHLEDFLRSSGIRGRGKRVLELLGVQFVELVKARLPWLGIGLLIGLLGSIIISRFEDNLRQNIALVFFIPIIPYMSGAIGTQTETIFIRSLMYLKFNIKHYILRELMLGVIVGSIIGVATAIFAYFLAGSLGIAVVVGLSLAITMGFASVLGVIIPLMIKYLGKDPAVGSGPFITAIQDLISIGIYFSIASIILKGI